MNTPKVIWVSFDPVFGKQAVLDEVHTEDPGKWSLKYRLEEEPEPNPNALHVPVWVVLMEGHRPYVSTVEHTPGYYEALKAAGHTVVRAEIEIPGYVIDDGKVKSRTVKE